MQAAIHLALMLLVPLALGAACLRIVGHRLRDDRLGWCAWAYVAGSIATAAMLAAWLLFGLPLRAAAIVPALAAFATLLGLWPVERDDEEPLRKPARVAVTAERAAFAVAVAVLLVSKIDGLALADASAVTWGDEAHVWSAKAKVIFRAGRIDDGFRELATRAGFVHQPDAPMLNPLLQLWAFVVAGRIDDVLNRVPIQAFALAGIVAFASLLRRTLRPAAAAACLFLTVPGDATAGIAFSAQSDGMVAVGLLMAIGAWNVFAETGEPARWPLVVIALTCVAWSNHEGAMIFAAFTASLALALALDREMRRRLFPSPLRYAWLLFPAAAVAFTWAFNARHGFHNDLAGDNPTGKPVWTLALSQFSERAWPVLRAFGQDVLFAPSASRLLFVALFGVCLFAPRFAFRGPRLVGSATLLAAIAVSLLVFVGHYRPLAAVLETDEQRVFFQLLPATALFASQSLASLAPLLAARRAA